jgi:hypothetical protein
MFQCEVQRCCDEVAGVDTDSWSSRWHLYNHLPSMNFLCSNPQCSATQKCKPQSHVPNQLETKQFRNCSPKQLFSRLYMSMLAVTPTVRSAVRMVRVVQVVRPTTRAFGIGVKISVRFFPSKPRKQMRANCKICGACLTAAALWAFDAPQPPRGPSYVARVGRNKTRLVPRDRQI